MAVGNCSLGVADTAESYFGTPVGFAVVAVLGGTREAVVAALCSDSSVAFELGSLKTCVAGHRLVCAIVLVAIAPPSLIHPGNFETEKK